MLEDFKIYEGDTSGKEVLGYLKLKKDYKDEYNEASPNAFLPTNDYYKVVGKKFGGVDFGVSMYTFVKALGSITRQYDVLVEDVEQYIPIGQIGEEKKFLSLEGIREILIKNAQNPKQAKDDIEIFVANMEGNLEDRLGSEEAKDVFFDILNLLSNEKVDDKKIKSKAKKVKSLEIKKEEKLKPIKNDIDVVDFDEIDIDEINLDEIEL